MSSSLGCSDDEASNCDNILVGITLDGVGLSGGILATIIGEVVTGASEALETSVRIGVGV